MSLKEEEFMKIRKKNFPDFHSTVWGIQLPINMADFHLSQEQQVFPAVHKAKTQLWCSHSEGTRAGICEGSLGSRGGDLKGQWNKKLWEEPLQNFSGESRIFLPLYCLKNFWDALAGFKDIQFLN